jgi:hypothetical protein
VEVGKLGESAQLRGSGTLLSSVASIVIAIVGIVLTEIVVHLERYPSRWRISERERF